METAAQIFAPVNIGTSPAGVEWIAYRPEAVEPMRARLAALWARHAAKNSPVEPVVTESSESRRVSLTPAQADLAADFAASYPAVTIRRTYLSGPVAELESLAADVEAEIDSAMELGAQSPDAQTDSEVAFAAVSAGLPAALLAAKLRGRKPTVAAVRRSLARRW